MKTLICMEHVGKKGWDSKIGSYIQFQGKRRMIQGRLMEDYEKENDGIFWMMQRSICLKAVYTQADMIEKRLYNEAETLDDGEIVQSMKIRDFGDRVENAGIGQYKFHALGDYSDCGKFEKVQG